MIHLSAQVKLVELETLQVIVKSNWQHTSLDETMKSSLPEFVQTHHFRLKFYAANIILTCRWIVNETLTFCEIKFGHKKYPHPLNP